MQRLPHFIILATVLAAGCGGGKKTTLDPAATTPPAATSVAPSIPLASLPAIEPQPILDRIKVLSSDEFEGRAPGTPGEDKTVAYLEGQFKAMGLKPGNTDGSYIQKVPLVGITVKDSPTLTFAKGGTTRHAQVAHETTSRGRSTSRRARRSTSRSSCSSATASEAPEFKWDDYKGVDVAGKTLVMLVNDPPPPPTRRQFGGNAMTYYGRWTYKYEQGMKHKAAGVLLVHETEPAGYPFAVVQGKTAEQFDLVTPDKNMGRANVEGWISLDQAKALFTMAGQNFDSLKAQAATREFTPVPLGVTASVKLEQHAADDRLAQRRRQARRQRRDS